MIDPLLAPLADNGGPTMTHALLPGSPAIDAGLTTLTTDQRGFTRPVDLASVPNAAGGNGADMGAFEAQELPSLIVTTAADAVDETDGVTSLREAIHFANSKPGADTITFDSNVFTGGNASLIRLNGAELEITDTLTINGTTATNVVITGDANDDDVTDANNVTDVAASQTASVLSDNTRVLNFSATSGDLSLQSLTITGGRTTGNNVYLGGGQGYDTTHSGGGIRFDSNGALTLTDSAVSGNHTIGRGANGGGISAASGTVSLIGSTVSGNSVGGTYAYGGGVHSNQGNVSVSGSTVSGNSTSYDGGGISTYTGAINVTGSTIQGNSSGEDGGGIATHAGAINVTGSTIQGNSSGDDGGGIRSSSGDITLTDSTVSGNNASDDGGGIRSSSGAITLTSSTVSGNSSVNDGGGIRSYSGHVALTHSTITNNSAASGGGVYVVNSYDNPGFTVLHSIIAGNTATTGPDLVHDPDSVLTIDYSLIGDTSGSAITAATGTGNVLDQPALLGPLADNGGPTQTHALLPGSPAIDAGDPNAVAGQNGVPEFDQRGMGFDRIANGRIDMGSFELQQALLSCDLDGDFDCDLDDIDAMIMEIAAGTNNVAFDLTGDGSVNLADRDQWLTDAGAMNLPSGNAYLLGDANLDGTVDGQDFISWNSHKFTATGKWSQGDWNADGTTDGQDFIIWNSNKFQSADSLSGSTSREVNEEDSEDDDRREGPQHLVDSVFAQLI